MPARPPFEEARSPHLSRGLNLGRHIFYFERAIRLNSKRATAFLTYAQYFGWRLGGGMASEVTSLGAHTDLSRPNESDLSSMVDTLGWRRQFPPMRKAWDTSERSSPRSPIRLACPPMCASSAARMIRTRLSCRISSRRREPFTVISTGTWVIIMAVGGMARLDPKADMLANVDVRGEPVPTARFMGGRDMQSLPATRRPTRTKPTSPPSSLLACSPCPHFPTRAARSPRAKVLSRAKRQRRRKRARRLRRSIRR